MLIANDVVCRPTRGRVSSSPRAAVISRGAPAARALRYYIMYTFWCVYHIISCYMQTRCRHRFCDALIIYHILINYTYIYTYPQRLILQYTIHINIKIYVYCIHNNTIHVSFIYYTNSPSHCRSGPGYI